MQTLTTNARELTIIRQYSLLAYYFAYHKLMEEYHNGKQQAWRYY